MNQFNPKILTQFRKLLYPAIAQGIITGYNVYPAIKGNLDSNIHYLHSDLKIGSNQKNESHLEALVRRLQDNFPSTITVNIASAVTDRIATYLWGDWKENPSSTQLFDILGNSIKADEIGNHCGKIIIEGHQYDLSIKPENWRQRTEILRTLLGYTHQKILNIRLKLTKYDNPHAIIDSWEIPLIVSDRSSSLLKRVIEVRIQIGSHQARTILKTPEKLIQHLDKDIITTTSCKIYVNTSFHNNYLIL